MNGKKGYAGSIKNTGTQHVKAPFSQSTKQNGTVKRGEDLRSGKK